MAKDKKAEEEYKLVRRQRTSIRKANRLHNYITSRKKRRDRSDYCCQYGSGATCDLSC